MCHKIRGDEKLKNFENFLGTKQGCISSLDVNSVDLLACGWSHLDHASTFSHHDWRKLEKNIYSYLSSFMGIFL